MDRITLSVGGQGREYLLLVPETRGVTSGARPLVMFLHGAGATADWADDETGWSVLAAREGFALALPEGTRPHPDRPPKFLTNPPRWDERGDLPPGTAGPRCDDVAFLTAVISDATVRAGIDPNRVCVSGFSNGAGMAFRVAAELADRIAAVAPVAGYCRVPNPAPTRPVPTLYILGSADPLVPPRGGEIRSPWLHRLVRRPPVAESLERWAAAIGCAPVPQVASDTDGVRMEVYPGPVEFRAVTVEGLGHHWPGGKGRFNHRIGGPPSDRFHATTAVWDFFMRIMR